MMGDRLAKEGKGVATHLYEWDFARRSGHSGQNYRLGYYECLYGKDDVEGVHLH